MRPAGAPGGDPAVERTVAASAATDSARAAPDAVDEAWRRAVAAARLRGQRPGMPATGRRRAGGRPWTGQAG
ncbi:MAG: hypothetical protein ACFCVG_09590, partial [Kineosporiaceae bacterium]